MAEMNPPQSWAPGLGPNGNNQYTPNVQQQNPGAGGYGNFAPAPSDWMGTAPTGYPPGGGNYIGEYNGAVGVNPASVAGRNNQRPYGNNQVFPNQNQGPPRYW